MKFKELWNLTGLPVLIASLCCLAPVVLVILGLSTVAFATSLTQVLDGQYRWMFLALGVVLLAISLVFYFRKRGVCTLDQARKHRNEILNKVLLVFIAFIVGYVVFFYGILGLVGHLLHLW
jgi:uncharacterized membrane protein YfcA